MSTDSLSQDYVCFFCGVYLVGAPYIKCAADVCTDVRICVKCFSKGEERKNHRNSHDYAVVKRDFSIFDPSWTASEELKLLHAIEEYGLGNWPDIASAVKSKSKTECMSHYMFHYIYKPKPPLPALKRTEETINSNLFPLAFLTCADPPRPDVGSSLYNETAGYMPARGDFATEHDDFLEHTLTLNSDEFNFEDNTATDPVQFNLQKAALHIFNNSVAKRALRKSIAKTHALIQVQKTYTEWSRYNNNNILDREILDNLKPLMRLMTPDKFDKFMEGILLEARLRQTVRILQECRKVGLSKLSSVRTFLKLKRREELELRPKTTLDDVLSYVKDDNMESAFIRKEVLKEANDSAVRRPSLPLSIIGLPGFEKLSVKERKLCSLLRLYPAAFLQYKSILVHENKKLGSLRLANARSVIKIDVNKTRKIYDLLAEEGAITKQL